MSSAPQEPTAPSPDRGPPRPVHDDPTVDLRGPTPITDRVDPVGVIDGRYELRGALGSGGHGVVYEALDREAGRVVALKLLRSAEGGWRERLRREGELAARLEHPGIVRVYSAGEDGGRPYLVLERVEGARPLHDALSERDAAGRLAWVLEVTEAVAHAHARGVLHRDLKPANVLVDAAGRTRVTDFGLAYAADLERLTETGGAVGTPAFMAPEVLRGERELGATVDVWALGVLLHLALTGELPFPGPGLDALRLQQRAGPPPIAREPGASRALEAVARRALALAPSGRYPDAAALASALREALARPERGARRVRLALLSAAALAALVALVALARRPGLAEGGGEVGAPREAVARVLEGEAPLPDEAELEAWRRALSAPGAPGDADALASLELLSGLAALRAERPVQAQRAAAELERALGGSDPRVDALRGLLELADPGAPLTRAEERLARATASRLAPPALSTLGRAALLARLRAALERGRPLASGELARLEALGPGALGADGPPLAAATLRRVAPLVRVLARAEGAVPLQDLDAVIQELRTARALDPATLDLELVLALLRRSTPLMLLSGDAPALGLRIAELAELAPHAHEVQLEAADFAWQHLDAEFGEPLLVRFLAIAERALATASDPGLRLDMEYLIVRTLDQLGRLEDAVTRASAILEGDLTAEQRAGLLLRRAYALEGLRQFEEALADYEQASRTLALRPELLMRWAWCLMECERRDEALALLERYFAAIEPSSDNVAEYARAVSLLWDATAEEAPPQLVARLDALLRVGAREGSLAGWWLRRASLRLRAGDLAGARNSARDGVSRAVDEGRRWAAAGTAAAAALEGTPPDPAPLEALLRLLDERRPLGEFADR